MSKQDDVHTAFDENVEETLNLHTEMCNLCQNDSPDVLNVTITNTEICDVIKDLPNGKSPGIDGFIYEMYKNGLPFLLNTICHLFNTILNTGTFPELWTKALISPIHKKGSYNDVNNFRGISLLCTLSKIFTKVLNNRLVLWAESCNKIDEGQCAYRKGRSTFDHIFTIHSLIQKYLCKKKGCFYCAFVDFSKAFDSIPHYKLWFRLISDGIHG